MPIPAPLAVPMAVSPVVLPMVMPIFSPMVIPMVSPLVSPMALPQPLPVSWLDAAALVLFLICVVGITLAIERSPPDRLSLGRLMAAYRIQWMRTMARRDGRIVDAQLLNIQQQGAAFFASAVMLGIGGVVALIANTDQLLRVADEVASGAVLADRALLEMKLLFLLFLLSLALLSFIWAHRLFAYCAILIGATPEDGPWEARKAVADQAATINTRAGRSYNRGLRLAYFSLATLAWLPGPGLYMAATLLTTAMLYRREFLSQTRRALMQPPSAASPTGLDAPGDRDG